jgi:hypothetical protein
MLGDSVQVYLDGGRSGHADPSTIVDLTGSVPRLLRVGAIPEDKIRSVVGVLLTEEDEAPEPAELTAAPSAAVEGKPSLTKEPAADAPQAPAEPAPAPTEPAPSAESGAAGAPAEAADAANTTETHAKPTETPAKPKDE